jgi:phosphatidylglycerophosphate synthase
MLVWGGYPQLLFLSLLIGFFYGIYICCDELKNKTPYGGYANWVTLFRGICLVLMLWYYPALTNLQIAIAGILLSLSDVLDGYLAKRLQSQTKMGAYLDEEMDAFYIITIGYIAYTKQLSGFYILLPGFAKYAKDLLSMIFAVWFSKPIKMPVAKWIAGISFVAYVTPFILPTSMYPVIAISSSMALCMSFIAGLILRFRRLSKNQ